MHYLPTGKGAQMRPETLKVTQWIGICARQTHGMYVYMDYVCMSIYIYTHGPSGAENLSRPLG